MKGVLKSLGTALNPSGASISKQQFFDNLFAQTNQRFGIDPVAGKTILNYIRLCIKHNSLLNVL